MKSLEIKNQKNKQVLDIPNEDFQTLVNAFAWLIQEDKKQNPNLYNKEKSIDG